MRKQKRVKIDKIVNTSCIEGMQKLPADSVDLIVADSPCDASDIQIDFSSNLILNKSKSNQEIVENIFLDKNIK